MRELDSSKELLELSRRDPLGFLDGGNVHKKPRARKENQMKLFASTLMRGPVGSILSVLRSCNYLFRS